MNLKPQFLIDLIALDLALTFYSKRLDSCGVELRFLDDIDILELIVKYGEVSSKKSDDFLFDYQEMAANEFKTIRFRNQPPKFFDELAKKIYQAFFG